MKLAIAILALGTCHSRVSWDPGLMLMNDGCLKHWFPCRVYAHGVDTLQIAILKDKLPDTSINQPLIWFLSTSKQPRSEWLNT